MIHSAPDTLAHPSTIWQTLLVMSLFTSFTSFSSAQSSQCAGMVGSNSNVGDCTCNLLYNWCDTDCCCDTDCSAQQIATFSSCITQSPADPELCSVNPTFGCVYYDNYQDRLYYASKPLTCDAVTFQQNMSQYASTFSFQPQLPTLPILTTFYRPGDPLYAYYASTSSSSAVDYFILPRSAGTSSVCVDSIPAEYLVSQSTSCARPLATTAACNSTTTALSLLTYCNTIYLAQPPPSTCSSQTAAACAASVNNVTASTTVLTSTAVLTCATASSLIPSYNTVTGQCQNVVTNVQYTVTHNYEFGIQSIQTVITLGSLNAAALATATPQLIVNQQFSISFVPFNFTAPSYTRSGNPGYLVGQPVLAGLYSSTSTGLPFIETPTNTHQQLTVLSPLGSLNSGCLQCVSNAQCYQPVLFGVNYRSGCLVNMTYNNYSSNCNDISSLLTVILWPWNSTSIGVAAFGNYTTDQAGSYVPILTDTMSPVSSGSAGQCNNMITGMNLQFLYQRTNTLANPQMRIVGAQLQYIQNTVTFRCITPFCSVGTLATLVQPVEIKVVVQFIDVSQPATMLQKLPPIFLAELPADFFYPFGMSGAFEFSPSVAVLSLAVFSALNINL